MDANYNDEITDGIDGFSNISLRHSGDRLQADGLTADPYDLVSLTLGVRRGPWELALIGNNLTDERGPTFLGT